MSKRSRSANGYAFSSYGVCAGARGLPPPGRRSRIATASVVDAGGSSRNCRVSRLHAPSARTAAIANATPRGGPACPPITERLLTTIHPWDVIRVEQAIDIRCAACERRVDLVPQGLGPARDADRDVEGKRKRGIDL